MQIAIVLYPGFTALDFIGPYESLRMLPDAEVRFVWHEPGPITADSGVLVVGATHSFDETPSPDVILVPGGIHDDRARPRREGARLAAQAHRDRNVDGVGVLRFDHARRRGTAGGQARHLALGGAAGAEGVGREAGRRRADRP